MKHLPRKLARIATVAISETDSFVAMTNLAGLDPSTAFRGADLRNVDFGTDDLTGFDFSFSMLHGANLSLATGLSNADFSGCLTDATTLWPDGFELGRAKIRNRSKAGNIIDLILSGDPIPDELANSVKYLDLSHTSLKHLKNLRNFYALETLDISFTKIYSLKSIRNLPSLEILNAKMTAINIISKKFSPPKLRELILSGCPIVNIDALASIHSLEYLDLSYTRVYLIKPLSILVNLRSLDVSFTKVNSIESFIKHPSLEEINVTGLRKDIEQRMESISDAVVTRHET